MGAYNDMVDRGHKSNSSLNQTATTTAVEHIQRYGNSIPKEITSWMATNRGTVNLLVSADGGTNFHAVVPFATNEARCDSVHSLQVKSASSTAGYDLYYTTAP
jgi:hypothetical protein